MGIVLYLLPTPYLPHHTHLTSSPHPPPFLPTLLLPFLPTPLRSPSPLLSSLPPSLGRAQIPVLVDEGVALTQSLAIIEYLEEKHAKPSLLPAGAVDRARARAVANTIASGIQVSPASAFPSCFSQGVSSFCLSHYMTS